MEQITLRVQPQTKESLEEEAAANGTNLSEYVRTLMRKRNEDTVAAAEYEQLQSECENLRTDNERLRREKQAILAQREENTQLKEYVQDERTLSMKKHNASAAQRIKWWVFGGD